MAGNTPRGIRRSLNKAGEPRYQVRYLIRDPDVPSGWVETSATFPTLREAKAFKSERDNEAALGARRFDPRLGRTPLNRIWTQFSDSKKPAVSPKTWSGYTQHWELRIKPRFGHVPVDEVTRANVQTFTDGLTVGPWAKVSTLRLLRSILDVAHQDGRIHRNPALGVSAGRIPERERHRYLSAPEVQRLATACGDQGDVVTLLAYTGLRWSELVGLRVKDIDLTPVASMSDGQHQKSKAVSLSGPPRLVPVSEPSRSPKSSSRSSRDVSPGGNLTSPPSPHPMARCCAPTTGVVRRRPSLRPEDNGPFDTNRDREHLQRPLRRRAGPGRNEPRSASRDRGSHTEDRTRTGRIKLTTECKTRVYSGEEWWPGPGSNRRPSAFQADARTN